MKPRVPASKYKKFIEFVEFLKANDATRFFDHIDSPDIFSYSERIWISMAFQWRASDEGEAFWDERNCDWNKLQREQNR